MPEDDQPKRIRILNWTFRVKEAQENVYHPKILLLLHGHLGNEKVMWILTKSIPDQYHMLAPRAPVKMGMGQYSWHEINPQWPEIGFYQRLTTDLLTRVDQWVDDQDIEVARYDVMGFSQGAVMAYALALLHPDRIGKVAALAAFIPRSWKTQINSNVLMDRQFYIAHGTKDDIVPIEKARLASEWLQEMGAQVNFCEADIGHKISANCFNGLGEFFQQEG